MDDGLTERLCRLAVTLARESVSGLGWPEPKPGDLVVEVTVHRIDPDAIGYLDYHGNAPYHAGDPDDGSVPMREVWDIKPLNPSARTRLLGGERVQRWENAQFVAVPERVARLAGFDLAPAPA